jgi:antitoxin HigA-1
VPMKSPVHRGALAKANLDELNLSVAEAAKTMKITRQQLHNVMQGRSAVTRFEKAFGGGADVWLRNAGRVRSCAVHESAEAK